MKSCASRNFHTFFVFLERRKDIMRIILDTDKKTITVPWNYAAKLEEYNNMVMAIANDPGKKKTFKTFIDDIWQECMKDTDKHLKVADKPKKPEKK